MPQRAVPPRACSRAPPPLRRLHRAPQPRRLPASAMSTGGAGAGDGAPIGNFNRARSSVAAERNTAPIVETVVRLLGADARGRVRLRRGAARLLPCALARSSPFVAPQALEVASGTGQHVAALAAALPGLEWQPTEVSADAFADIEAHASGRANVRAPLLLDAAEAWPAAVGRDLAAVLCVNLTHISAWRVTLGLVAGAGAALRPGGMLLIYGPFLVDGVATTESNAAFDASLRASNAEWGYRDRGVVAAEALKAGLHTVEMVAMPANNFLLAFRKAG